MGMATVSRLDQLSLSVVVSETYAEETHLEASMAITVVAMEMKRMLIKSFGSWSS